MVKQLLEIVSPQANCIEHVAECSPNKEYMFPKQREEGWACVLKENEKFCVNNINEEYFINFKTSEDAFIISQQGLSWQRYTPILSIKIGNPTLETMETIIYNNGTVKQFAKLHRTEINSTKYSDGTAEQLGTYGCKDNDISSIVHLKTDYEGKVIQKTVEHIPCKFDKKDLNNLANTLPQKFEMLPFTLFFSFQLLNEVNDRAGYHLPFMAVNIGGVALGVLIDWLIVDHVMLS